MRQTAVRPLEEDSPVESEIESDKVLSTSTFLHIVFAYVNLEVR